MDAPLFRHTGVGLLRAAAQPLSAAEYPWPDLSDAPACRAWLAAAWGESDATRAIRQASPQLAARLDAINAGQPVSDKQLRAAATSTVRYLLRAAARPTPFGLFAGVAPVRLGERAAVRLGHEHRPQVAVDTAWLTDVIEHLEAEPEVLERLEVVWNNQAVRRGLRVEVPQGPHRASVRHTTAVQTVQDTAAVPVSFTAVVEKLTAVQPEAVDKARRLVGELVGQGFLITNLRAPLTEPDPLAHLVDRLQRADPHHPMLESLRAVQAGLRDGGDVGEVVERARELSTAGRSPVAVHLRLDADVEVPLAVAEEVERAASALLRLSRQPSGPWVWRDYYVRFCERWGTHTLVPLAELLHPDSGLGLPATYPGSPLPGPVPTSTERDEELGRLAWKAMADGSGEIVLTDALIDRLSGGRIEAEHIPPHVEMSVRIHAVSTAALQAGDYRMVVHPARSAGTLTGRFADTVPGLAELYRGAPTATEGALPVQLSAAVVYPHAENICRIPTYLKHVISVGEHRPAEDGVEVIGLDDLAVSATRKGLVLVSISRRRVVEPQTFHALALDKQLPPLARFLAHIGRSYLPAWTVFDWGPHQHLPYLPQVRYGRTVLSPARWHLTADDLADATDPSWSEALAGWRARWRCPALVQLGDDSSSLRLDLTVPAHQMLLKAHLKRHQEATLTGATDRQGLGWMGGHAHEIAIPLIASRPPAPNPLTGPMAQATTMHGQAPGAADWLNVKLHTHPEQAGEIIAHHLPELLAELGDPAWWFVRYHSGHETDHLRLRLQTPDLVTVAAWADRLRRAQIAGRMAVDTYYPEIGRYGPGQAMEAARRMFVADSQVVVAQLRHLPPAVIDPLAVSTVGMVGLTHGLFGPAEGTRWLATQPVPPGAPCPRDVAAQARRAIGSLTSGGPTGWPDEVADAWRMRHEALDSYRRVLPDSMDINSVMETVIHLHHNRLIAIDRDREIISRRLARQAARSLRIRQAATQP